MNTLKVDIIKHQRGFTLIELIIAIAITSVVLATAAGTVYQLLAGNSHNSNAMLATRNLQQAGHWVSQDIMMAQEVYPALPATVPDIESSNEAITLPPILTLYWFEFTTYDPSPEGEIISKRHKVTYELTINKSGSNPLTRTHYVTAPIDHDELDYENEVWTEESSQLVANYISFRNTEELSIVPDSLSYKLTITTYVPGFRPAEEKRIYEIKSRPE
jgi:prepilin-type N-terminal cleavage/methylation domain-containing protein